MTDAAALLELQALDLEILRAKKRLEELPEKRAILEIRAKQRDVSELRHKAEVLVGKLSADLKGHQDEITMLTDKIAAEQAKVMATTDHRAVTSITREMDGLKRRRDKVEMESLQLMERIEKAKAQEATIDAALSQLADKEAAAVERFKVVGGALQKEIAANERKREVVSGTISAPLIERYESARASKGGVGVGRLDGDSCSACRMSLPAERIGELEAGDDVGTCPQCRRLLVVRTGDE